MGLLLLLVCAAVLELAKGQSLDRVICYSGERCLSPDDIGVMSARDCCLNNRGVTYRGQASEICVNCIVFGFFQDSFTGVERESEYVVQAGYQKGRLVASRDLEFSVIARDGTAKEGSNLDYTVNTTQVLASSSVSAPPEDVVFNFNLDGVALESNETFSLELVPTSTTSLPLGDFVYFLNTLNLTIIDNDPIDLTVEFERDAYDFGESDGFAVVCLLTNTGHAEQFDVVVRPEMKGVDRPAASNSDFVADEQTVTFEASDSSSRKCVNIRIIGDVTTEGDEQFLVSLGDISNGQVTIGDIQQVCVTIMDDDVPEVSLMPLNVSVTEGDPNGEVCVVLNGALSENVEISVTLAFVPKADADNQATADSDYNSTAIIVTFQQNDEPVQTVCVPLPIIDDVVASEADEQFSVVLINMSPIAIVTNNQTCVTIMDDDIPVFNLSPVDIVVSESIPEVEVCVNLAEPFSLGRRVVVTAESNLKFGAPIDATANSDFVATTFQVTFEPLGGARKICTNVQIINDEIANEPDEQFSVYLNFATPGADFGVDESCITIIDDDVVEIRLTPLNITVSENENVTVCLTLNDLLARNVIATADTGPKFGASNQATAGSDYETTTITVTFEPRNESLQTICGKVGIIDDEITNEMDEQFSIRLISATPDGNLGVDVTCVTIIDNDELICPENAVIVENSEGMLVCQCLPGYTGDPDPFVSCVDIDECATMTDDCSENANCINTEGSFECVCKPGYTGDGRVCEDIDECATMTDDCSENANCINTEGSFECDCKPGYTGDGRVCEDIDECAIMTDDCSENANCINTEGSFECDCKPGYTGDGRVCEDIDECAAMTDDCSENANCINTEGSFECDCKPGYTGDGRVCEDIDECATMTDDCSENADCINTEGSFECDCKPGYTGDGRVCEDIDECAIMTDDCSENANCINTEGSFECDCKPGYTGDGRVCEDIDECAIMTDDCSENADCINTEGSFECVCKPGYTGDGKVCEDIDECAAMTDDCSENANCINTEGSFECDCKPGYTGDGRNCEDIDECAIMTDDCSENADCINTEGSFECICKPGYSGDGKVCEDIDECAIMTDDCSENANCINTEGSFECDCKPGFTGDGRVCEEIFEDNPCLTCSVNADCIRTEEGFECMCKIGYSGDGIVCEDIDECTVLENVCGEYISCSNLRGGFRCECTQHNGTSCITREVTVASDIRKTSSKSSRSRTRSGSSGSGSGRHSRSKRSISPDSSKCTPKRRSRNMCGCGEGYTLDPTGAKCIDINECETGSDDCDLYITCINLPGTFKCVCSDCITMDEMNNIPSTTTSTRSRESKSTSSHKMTKGHHHHR